MYNLLSPQFCSVIWLRADAPEANSTSLYSLNCWIRCVFICIWLLTWSLMLLCGGKNKKNVKSAIKSNTLALNRQLLSDRPSLSHQNNKKKSQLISIERANIWIFLFDFIWLIWSRSNIINAAIQSSMLATLDNRLLNTSRTDTCTHYREILHL